MGSQHVLAARTAAASGYIRHCSPSVRADPKNRKNVFPREGCVFSSGPAELAAGLKRDGSSSGCGEEAVPGLRRNLPPSPRGAEETPERWIFGGGACALFPGCPSIVEVLLAPPAEGRAWWLRD